MSAPITESTTSKRLPSMPLSSADIVEPSHGPVIDQLTQAQQIRLTHLLDEYLQALEQGTSFDAQHACQNEPALQDALELYIEKLSSLYEPTSNPVNSPGAAQTIGDFTLVREIGRGGMGIVYEAVQARMERRVAMKLLPLASTLAPQQITRFQNESRAAGSLNHPHIVPVYSVGEADGVHFYTMQLIGGVSMDTWICNQADDDGPLVDWRTVVRWGIDIADALHCAHETGVIHRDVKPSNLMLDDDRKIWITDFGLARCQANLSLTLSGDVVGTLRYMSPEQARGQSALVDGRCDVYALATTLYEMLTLQPAHQGDHGSAILHAIDRDNVKPLGQSRPDVPRDLDTVIAKAMAHSRDDRYETSLAFAEDLRRVLANEPTLAKPPTTIDRATRWVSKHRRLALSSALIGMVGFVGLAISTAIIASEKKVSDAQTIRAEQNEQLARGAVDRLGSQMAELLSGIPAADSVRRQLLAETLNYYQQFAATADDTPEFRQALAVTHGKIGELHDELGAPRDALEHLHLAEKIHARLSHESPENLQTQLRWSISQNNLARSLHRSGDLEGAAVMFASAIRIQERLIDAPTFSFEPKTLAATFNNLGLLLAESGATQEAETHFLRSAELLQSPVHARLISSPPSNDNERQLLASVLVNLGNLVAERDPQKAVQYARDSLKQLTKSFELEPNNAKLAVQVVTTLRSLGKAQSRVGDHESATETFRRSVDVVDQLLTRWPEQTLHRRDLILSLNHLGLSLSKQGQLREALRIFEQAIDHQEPLVKQFPSDAQTHSLLGGILNNRGFLHQRLGNSVAAKESFVLAEQHQAIAVRLAPKVPRYQEHLKTHRYNLAHTPEAS